MIDYITIMRKIILFINSAVTNERIDKHVNNAKKHLSKSQTVIYEIYNWSEKLYLTIGAMFVIGYLIYTKKQTPFIDMLIAIAIFLIASLVISITFVLITPNYVYRLNNNAIKEIELETANTLPNGTITKEDILSFDGFDYDKPADTTIYDKGNLYNLPLPTILKETNVQSIKNLYDNINFLDDYYDNNYINDDRYHWINVQLNAFYNSNLTDNTNADILRNLKN